MNPTLPQTKSSDTLNDQTLAVSAPAPRANRDQGAELLNDMEHFVWLVRKVRNNQMICRLLDFVAVSIPDELQQKMAKSKGLLPPPLRKQVFLLVADADAEIRKNLERIAERVELLDDEYGRQAVLSLLDGDHFEDTAILALPGDAQGRALYLCLEQETPGFAGQRRFEHAERVRDMLREWKSENYSSHFEGPKGTMNALDEETKARLKQRIMALYPKVGDEDILIEHFTRHDRGARKGDDESGLSAEVALDTLTVTFNGTEAHYKKVENGEVVFHDDLAALSIKFSREPKTGALSVFSEDRESRQELAAIFRDVLLATDSDISALPIREFDLSPFTSPEILTRINQERIPGIEEISITNIKVTRSVHKRAEDLANDRRLVQKVSCPLTIGRDRRDERDIYTIASQTHRIPDFMEYWPARIRLVMRIGKQAFRKAHTVAVQLTAPNGYNDRSKTEDDRKLVLAQLEKLGLVRQF